MLACIARMGAQTPTPAQCAQITANARANPTRIDTLGLVGSCPGAFGPVFADLLQSAALFADSATYDLVVEWVSLRSEPEILAVALGDLSNESQLRLRRLAAEAILLRYVSPAGTPSLDVRTLPVAYEDVQGCSIGPGRAARPGEGTLPATMRSDTHAAAQAVAQGPGPETVRFLAYCLIDRTADSMPGVHWGGGRY